MTPLTSSPAMRAIARDAGDQRGFSLLETLVALALLASSLLGLAAVFTTGMGALAAATPDIVAREKAAEAIESVYTARDTRTITWDEIRNVDGESGSDGGVFLDGEQSLRAPGPDGLVNTEDDAGIEAQAQPGPDNQLGTGDDILQPLSQYTREIRIRDVDNNLRRITVTIRYSVGSVSRTYTVETLISSLA